MRLFIGIPIHDAAYLRAAQQPLIGIPGVRLADPRDAHLTLKFLGEVPERAIGGLIADLERIAVPAFTIALDGIGAFPTLDDPRVIFIRGDGPQELHDLAALVHEATRSIAYDKPFHPHVTIARCAGRLRLPRIHAPLLELPADGFILYDSTPVPGGPRYRIVKGFPLR